MSSSDFTRSHPDMDVQLSFPFHLCLELQFTVSIKTSVFEKAIRILHGVSTDSGTNSN